MYINRFIDDDVCVCVYIPVYIYMYRYIYNIHIYICASVHTSERSYAQLYLTRGRPRWRAARADSGAYLGQRGDRGGVPRADVRVERRRREERLRAEPPAVDADGKALACFGADAWAPDRTHARARTRTHTWGACARPYLPLTAVHTYIYVYKYHICT